MLTHASALEGARAPFVLAENVTRVGAFPHAPVLLATLVFGGYSARFGALAMQAFGPTRRVRATLQGSSPFEQLPAAPAPAHSWPSLARVSANPDFVCGGASVN